MCLAIENGPNLSAVRDYFLQVFQKDNELAKIVSFFINKFYAEHDFFAFPLIHTTISNENCYVASWSVKLQLLK